MQIRCNFVRRKWMRSALVVIECKYRITLQINLESHHKRTQYGMGQAKNDLESLAGNTEDESSDCIALGGISSTVQLLCCQFYNITEKCHWSYFYLKWKESVMKTTSFKMKSFNLFFISVVFVLFYKRLTITVTGRQNLISFKTVSGVSTAMHL